MKPLITLTTDFGERDPYVAAMKGMIHAICPEAGIVDLTHAIAPQDVLEGSFFLAGALPYWSAGTIHVAVVDPGVGTDRRPIAISADGKLVVCPDNGLATVFLRQHPLYEARVIENAEFILANASTTFHGRDIFAPAAAHLACGISLEQLGGHAKNLVTLSIPGIEISPERILGVIVHVDHFGNLITNIHSRALPQRIGTIHAGGERVAGLSRTYAECQPGTPTAIIGSSGYLEIAVNGASAQEALRLNRGDSVIVDLEIGGSRD